MKIQNLLKQLLVCQQATQILLNKTIKYWLIIAVLCFTKGTLAQSINGDSLRQEIMIDACKTILSENSSNKNTFFLLNIDVNYRSLYIDKSVYGERYVYRDQMMDTILLKNLQSKFSLNPEFNFVNNHNYHDFEYVAGLYLGDTSILTMNDFNKLCYYNIKAPLEGWDILYLLKDSLSYFKDYRKVDLKTWKLTLNIPVIEYTKNTASPKGIEKKFILQYEVNLSNKQYSVKLLRKLML